MTCRCKPTCPKDRHTTLGCLYPGCPCVQTRNLKLNWRRINPGAYRSRMRAKRRARAQRVA